MVAVWAEVREVCSYGMAVGRGVVGLKDYADLCYTLSGHEDEDDSLQSDRSGGRGRWSEFLLWDGAVVTSFL